jgi:hypothetical protein
MVCDLQRDFGISARQHANDAARGSIRIERDLPARVPAHRYDPPWPRRSA